MFFFQNMVWRIASQVVPIRVEDKTANKLLSLITSGGVRCSGTPGGSISGVDRQTRHTTVRQDSSGSFPANLLPLIWSSSLERERGESMPLMYVPAKKKRKRKNKKTQKTCPVTPNHTTRHPPPATPLTHSPVCRTTPKSSALPNLPVGYWGHRVEKTVPWFGLRRQVSDRASEKKMLPRCVVHLSLSLSQNTPLLQHSHN